MNYLDKYDNFVIKKCLDTQRVNTFALNNLANGRVTKSKFGGYVAQKPLSGKDLVIGLSKHGFNSKEILKGLDIDALLLEINQSGVQIEQLLGGGDDLEQLFADLPIYEEEITQQSEQGSPSFTPPNYSLPGSSYMPLRTPERNSGTPDRIERRHARRYTSPLLSKSPVLNNLVKKLRDAVRSPRIQVAPSPIEPDDENVNEPDSDSEADGTDTDENPGLQVSSRFGLDALEQMLEPEQPNVTLQNEMNRLQVTWPR